ncbi:MAG TPA: ABC transporter permease [Rhabdochlamydiaceae bacterium]|nr:ABC transporter permease [Rhabdochlamydiaceae bacterium]
MELERKSPSTWFERRIAPSHSLHFLVALGEYIGFVWQTFKVILRRPPAPKLLFKQLYNIGVASLGVVSTTGFFTGLVLAAQSFYQLAGKGLASVTGLMVGKAMMTELGPVLTAFMVTGRVGAAMCAELGSMKVTEQIDALQTMSVNPLRYLVAPRLMAGLVMMPLLTIYSVIIGILGGYLISVFYFGMSPESYLDHMPMHLTLFDFFTGIIKAFFFGLIIMSVSCYRGMNTEGGAEGVGKTTTNSVVLSYCCILFMNFVLTMTLNLFYEQIAKIIE